MKNKPLISVVDDDQSVREALGNLISSVGFNVKLFASAEAFLDSDAPLQTDCAVLDLWLPGISGLELQRRLAADGQSIPAIIITANGNEKAQGRIRIFVITSAPAISMDRRWADRRRGALGLIENYAHLSDEKARHQTRTTGYRLLRSCPLPDFLPSFTESHLEIAYPAV